MLSKTLAIIILCSTISYSQFILDECPDQIICVDELLNMQVTIPIPTGSESFVINCEGDNFSQMNMVFEAPAHVVTIGATWLTDENLKMGVLSFLGCGEESSCMDFVFCNSAGEMSMTVDLIPGRTYILYIDACDNTDPVDVDVSIDPINLTEIFEETMELELRDTQTYGCANLPFELVFWLEDFEYWNNRYLDWTITYEGPTWGEVTSNELDNFLVQIEQPGEYIICFERVQTECWVYYGLEEPCFNMEIVGNVENQAVYDVCEHELNEGWVPSSSWDGPTITEPGLYEGEFQDGVGCYVNQVITVNEISEKETEIEVELCPQDYPYDFMGEEEYDYSQENIEDFLTIYEGSLVEDYNGDPCDSIVYLILVNEKPQDRCSSCNLPVSLEKGKIVFCLPFDNATIDVSGRNTIVRPTGINYDDNGSKENDFWEAILDGNEDYITIPHIDDLNTSIFSVNFQFNKDESFENGNKETLISKGDNASDNLRYDVALEKTNESIFDLTGTFYTANGQVEVIMPDLQVFEWYDVAYVVEPDTISLYLDGYIFSKTPITENLRGNTEDLYIGTLINNNARTQFYNGRLDNFKYWKQKLSGQDVFFLHFPEKEFEVDQSYFLACCEEAVFRDVVIDIDNPLDSVVVPNASPTGYDSVYILNYIQADQGPELNMLIAPQDIVVQYQQSCQEFCQSTVNWSTDLNNLFTDNCSNVTVSQSHNFEILLDENVSFVEVTITGTDDCGQSTEHSFGLELECLPSNIVPVPEQNAFEVMVNDMCINDNDEICIFSDIQLQLGFIDTLTNAMQPYESTANYEAVININGIATPFTSTDVSNGVILDNLTAGTYVICLDEVSNACETVINNYCNTITIRESNIIDHGEITSCRDDIELSLPSELSAELRNLILSNPQETSISVTEQDACGCEDTEKISLVINESIEEELSIQLCEGDIFDGRTENEIFSVQLIGSNGCDSLVHVDLVFLPKTEEVVFAEICEGEFFEGFTEEGTYIVELSNVNGCDSTLTIQLSVLPKSYDDIFVEICPDSTYLGYSETGTYELLGTNLLGCDSITTLNLLVLGETDPACFVSAVYEEDLKRLSLFPNPVANILNLSKGLNEVFNIEIYSVSGKLIKKDITIKNKIDVSQIDKGVYFLKATNMIGNSNIIKFVKI